MKPHNLKSNAEHLELSNNATEPLPNRHLLATENLR
jgi:hypothetical protein